MGSVIVILSLSHGAAAAPPRAVGADRVDVDGVLLRVAPAVVLVTVPGATLPPGAHRIGMGSGLLPVANAAEAVAQAEAMAAWPGVLGASPDYLWDAQAPAGDDPWRDGQWYLDLLDIEALHARSTGDAAVRVAVIDSGISIGLDDLAPGVVAPFDAFAGDDDPRPEPGEGCFGGEAGLCDDHGTAVAAIVGARRGNGVGIAGLCPACSIVPIRMLGEGSGRLSADVAAFEHAIAADAAVINNSWGFTRRIPVPDALAAIIRRATVEPRDGRGALVVFAAGNDDREVGLEELAAMEEVLCVAATDTYGYPTAYSNSGPALDVAAPSATVSLDANGELLTTFGGTSAAAPVVSGLAGWALSVDPALTAAELHALLVDTARPSPLVTADANGFHPLYGYGEVDTAALLDALSPGAGADTGSRTGAPSKTGGCAAAPSPAGLAALAVAASAILPRRRRGPRGEGGPSSRAGASWPECPEA